MLQSPVNAISSFFMSLKWADIARTCEISVFALFVAISVNIIATSGMSGLTKYYVETLRKLPFVNNIISAVVASEVKGAMTLLAGGDGEKKGDVKMVTIPVSNVQMVVLYISRRSHHLCAAV
jgi:hypothetical protein